MHSDLAYHKKRGYSLSPWGAIGPGLFRAYALHLSAERGGSAMPGAEVAGRKTPEPGTHGEIHLMYFLFDRYFLHRVSGSISRDRSRRVVPPLAMQSARGFAPSVSVCLVTSPEHQTSR